MKTIILIMLSASLAFTQTVYKVTPGSKGNQIILTVENESKEKELTNVKVKLMNQFSSFNFRSAEEEIEKIERGSSKEAEFSFDANITDDVNKTDTLRFLITGSEGTKQQKEILIGYELPTEYVLEQNYPNPFNPETMIKYVLPEASNVTLKVYDILGKEVAALVNENQQAGIHYSTLSTRHSTLASGVYFYQLRVSPSASSGHSFVQTKKMMILK
ncbi:MAG: T9SS type A sorting domain-containing protein [Ignavibacteriales bacterium]|nr:T9SS type A sorting domain-containing protein [Ignavibacteriales bacterium]